MANSPRSIEDRMAPASAPPLAFASIVLVAAIVFIMFAVAGAFR